MKILEAVSKLNFHYERLQFPLVLAMKAVLKPLLETERRIQSPNNPGFNYVLMYLHCGYCSAEISTIRLVELSDATFCYLFEPA